MIKLFLESGMGLDYHSVNGNHHVNQPMNAPERTFFVCMKTTSKKKKKKK